MPAVLFDLDGVLYVGDKAIEGAADTIDWAIANNIPHLFLTNTTSKPRSALVEKLGALGIATNADQYLTPPLAAVQVLEQQQCRRIALFIPEATQMEFSEFTRCDSLDDEIDAVVIGDLAGDWSFEKLNDAFRLLMKNPDAILVALGLTRYWRTQTGLQLDAGPFVKALEYASGREAVVTGKPAAEFYRVAVSKLSGEQEIFMIGDDIRGDIEAAQDAGLKAIQVKTGKFTEADLGLGIAPDGLLDSIKGLPEWWAHHVNSAS